MKNSQLRTQWPWFDISMSSKVKLDKVNWNAICLTIWWVNWNAKCLTIWYVSYKLWPYYSTNHVYLHRPNAFGFWQMRLHLCYENTQTYFELFWIGLRIRNAFGMNRNCTFRVCLFSQILICDLWAFGGCSFIPKLMFPKPLVKSIWAIMCDVTGHSHWIDNVRCKMNQTRLQVKRTSRLRLKRKLKSVWK